MIYDILIVGGGVAGMSAAIYAKRRGKNVAIIEKFSLGGQVAELTKIENFPSQIEIDGASLTSMFSKQMKHLQVEAIYDDVVDFDFQGDIKTIYGKKKEYQAKSIILAMGIKYLELGTNENDFLGRGVSYCATCDANFFKGKDVCVASRNGSGIKDALYLAGVANSVTVFDEADMSVFAKANTQEKVRVISNTKVLSVSGSMKLQEIEVSTAGKKQRVKTDALFVALGRKPATEKLVGKLNVDEKGYILTDEHMQTSANGVFAVGDIRAGSLKQIVTACNDGAIAGQYAE